MSIENIAVLLFYYSIQNYTYILTLNIVDHVVHSIKTSPTNIRIRIFYNILCSRKLDFLSRSKQILCYTIRIFQLNLKSYQNTDIIYKLRDIVHFP